jgi:hypothetical protein
MAWEARSMYSLPRDFLVNKVVDGPGMRSTSCAVESFVLEWNVPDDEKGTKGSRS